MVITMKKIMDQEQLSRTLKRMTHEIIEQNNNLADLVLIGILKKGFPVAQILKENLKQFTNVDILIYALDISMYRDDQQKKQKPQTTLIDISNKNVVLVDDVLYTGRTVRAAMDALTALGRAKTIQLAVLIDRGHRELPIRADYVGKNIPTSKHEKIFVDPKKEVTITSIDN